MKFFLIFVVFIIQSMISPKFNAPKANEPTPNGLSYEPFAVGVFNFMETEIWKDVPEYEGRYHVSNLGRLKSLSRERRPNAIYREFMVIGQINHRGYYRVCLYKNAVGKIYSLHRLIALAFIPNPENKPEVNHKDGNKLNNRIDNLEWATRQENCIHAYANGLLKKGKNHYKARAVNQYTLDGEFIRRWDCIMDLRREKNYFTGNISKCCKGEYHSAHNFIWRYA